MEINFKVFWYVRGRGMGGRSRGGKGVRTAASGLFGSPIRMKLGFLNLFPCKSARLFQEAFVGEGNAFKALSLIVEVVFVVHCRIHFLAGL